MSAATLKPADLGNYAGRWTLDPARTTISFQTKAMWFLPVKGTANAQAGGGSVTPEGAVEGRLVIDATSISTGVAKRDKHLQTSDFFDTETSPTIEFDLAGVREGKDGRVILSGTLLVHGSRHPIDVDAEVTADSTTATITGTVDDLDRRVWGLTWAKMGAGVHNKVRVNAVFTRS